MNRHTLILIVWFLSAALVYAEYCYFWQLKWYRIDRFRDYLSTKQGKYLLNNRYVIARTILAIFLFITVPFNHTILLYSIGTIFIFDILHVIWRKYRGVYRRPSMSIKALIIIMSAVILEYIVYAITKDWIFILLMSALRLYILSLIVIAINWLTDQIKRIYFRKAENKLKKYPKLIRIGITGSYGKTSVKELLAQILSHSYHVAYTPKNTNSDIGISKFILATDFSNIDICIIEMGAYNKGDIKLVCDIVHPTIGILTAINQQHLSLFGSIQNIQSTKYELLRSIPKSGVSITNADNRLCMEWVAELESKVLTFGIESENHPNCLIESANQKGDTLEIRYSLHMEKSEEKMQVQTKVIGEHQATNIAACILAAKTVGMSNEKIATAIESLTQPDQLLKIFSFGKATIIDDSYNSNPDGFKAALELIGSFPSSRRRVVLTRGMHELGSESSELHERIGNEISFFADELVIITPDFASDMKRGILEKYHTVVKEIFETEELMNFVKNLKDENVVVLIENKVPDTVRELYSSNNQST